MRLDHLLSKEHHEKHLHREGVSRDGVVRCSGADRVHNNKFPCPALWWGGGMAAGTLLGPETTPGPVRGLCCRPVLVVGCGVW